MLLFSSVFVAKCKIIECDQVCDDAILPCLSLRFICSFPPLSRV